MVAIHIAILLDVLSRTALHLTSQLYEEAELLLIALRLK